MRCTICGSARFEKEFREWDEMLALHLGTVNYNLVVYPSEKGGKDWYSPYEKIQLDVLHFKKIIHSDMIVVLDYTIEGNPEKMKESLGPHFGSFGYIGESTAREILMAQVLGISVYFASQHKFSAEFLAENMHKESGPVKWGAPV